MQRPSASRGIYVNSYQVKLSYITEVDLKILIMLLIFFNKVIQSSPPRIKTKTHRPFQNRVPIKSKKKVQIETHRPFQN